MLFPGTLSARGRHAGQYDPRTSKAFWFWRGLIVFVLLCLLAWPFAEPFLLQTEYVSLKSPDLPGEIGQLRIVYVSDIHKGGLYTQGRVRGLVNSINAMGADIVLLGGDYADDSESAIAFFQELPAIRSKYGVFGVLGNHDRTLPEENLPLLKSAMRSAGVTPLVNQVQRLDIGRGSIYLVGIDDVNNGHPATEALAKQVRAGDYVIFLSHSPAVIDQATAYRDKDGMPGWFDLGLFGHTHGGQVAIFGPMLRDDGVDAVYREGWTVRSRADLLTSRGVGTTGLPVRWLCLPQMHVITVTTAY